MPMPGKTVVIRWSVKPVVSTAVLYSIQHVPLGIQSVNRDAPLPFRLTVCIKKTSTVTS